jgi:predicted lipoprotein with Yx(FWY)xxD motif
MNMLISRRLAAAAGAASLALLAVGCGSSSSSTAAAPATTSSPTAAAASSAAASPSTAAAAAVLKTEHTTAGTVLANDKGYTLYWFAKDTATSSACTGACATYWPPVIGTPQAASGVTLTGKLGTIKRSDGSLQATYNGHPLYTYVGDKAPGQATGNKLNLSGGLWYAVTIGASSGTTPATSSTGYGY